jgi:hypothetical protein
MKDEIYFKIEDIKDEIHRIKNSDFFGQCNFDDFMKEINEKVNLLYCEIETLNLSEACPVVSSTRIRSRM